MPPQSFGQLALTKGTGVHSVSASPMCRICKTGVSRHKEEHGTERARTRFLHRHHLRSGRHNHGCAAYTACPPPRRPPLLQAGRQPPRHMTWAFASSIKSQPLYAAGHTGPRRNATSTPTTLSSTMLGAGHECDAIAPDAPSTADASHMATSDPGLQGSPPTCLRLTRASGRATWWIAGSAHHLIVNGSMIRRRHHTHRPQARNARGRRLL